ncbi:GspH/FimT family pseudopilin [Zhongshania sp. BJYM1]|uniref:GspH/FimT family pseudopilin n=1 Tax=Zhongshania aquatica TaxID=2965069 RepID=UPI0022B5B9D7|nr:GspH/FimT family pseudopilin [Marortus sp. BJYM1]
MANRGMTLVELITALAIAAILVVGAAPPLTSFIRQYQLRSTGQQLFRLMTTARATAVMRSRSISIWNEDGDWTSGVTVFEDDNGNGKHEDGEQILLSGVDQTNIQITGNRWVADYVKFAADGSAQTANGAFQVGTITICTPKQTKAYQLIISIGGRIRMIKTDIDEC